MRKEQSLLVVALLACVSQTLAQTDLARSYPSRPVKVVYGYAPGGADTPGRLITQKLSEVMGQSFIFDYKPGGDSIPAADSVAKAAPDGYTLLYITASNTLNTILHAKTIPYHPVRDFTAISLTAYGPQVVVLNPGVPANDLKSFIALAKAKPGQLNFASSGIGGPTHLSGEMLNQLAGIQVVHVPYKGGGPSISAVLSGEVEMTVVGAPGAMPHIRAGKLKAIAVTTKTRASALPDVPTVIEQGVPNYDVTAFYGFMGPSGLPPAIVSRLNSEMVKFLQQQDTKEKYTALGLDAAGTTPEQMLSHMTADLAKWEPVARKAGIKID